MVRNRLLSLCLAALGLGAFAGLAVVARQAPPAAAPMTGAAKEFLASLDAPQKTQAQFLLSDRHREEWYFTPRQENKLPTRKGLRFDQLKPTQRALALQLLRTGLSAKGYAQATTVMGMESVLLELEKNGANARNPDWYFISIFGEPSATGAWGWRVEGHHLSVNYTLDAGRVVSAAPVLFGANPAEVREGARKGLRPLPETEDEAKSLIAALTAEQLGLARKDKQFPEIREGGAAANVGPPTGVRADQLTDGQRKQLDRLVAAYAERLPPDLAAAESKRASDAGAENIFFAFCREDDKPGKPYSYRVQGPTFVIEFLNVQPDASDNPANHIHSAWRRLPADFTLGDAAK